MTMIKNEIPFFKYLIFMYFKEDCHDRQERKSDFWFASSPWNEIIQADNLLVADNWNQIFDLRHHYILERKE